MMPKQKKQNGFFANFWRSGWVGYHTKWNEEDPLEPAGKGSLARVMINL